MSQFITIEIGRLADGRIGSGGTPGSGDMEKAVYDTNDDGIVNQAATVTDGAITSAKIADGTIVAGDIADGAITSAKILDGTIVNADINGSAAIAISKTTAGTAAALNVPASGDAASGEVVKGSDTRLSDVRTPSDGSVTNIKVASGANIALAKLAITGTPSGAKFLRDDGVWASPAGAVGAVVYQGTWNANTNSPSLASGVGTQGYYYKVSTNGATSIDGITDWKAGDWIIYNGSAWEKVDNTDAVPSVAGRTGAVTLSDADISGLGNSATKNVGTTAGTVAAGDDSRFTDTRTPTDGSVTSAKIADGAIVNADINASAAIDATKIGAGGVTSTEFGYLDGVTSPIQTQLDGKQNPLGWAPVRVASTANVSTSSAPSSIDGVTLASGNRILLKDQTTGSANGIYTFASAGSALTRATDFDASSEAFPAGIVAVSEGTVNGNTLWQHTTPAGLTLGTTSLTFAQLAVSSGQELGHSDITSDATVTTTQAVISGLVIGPIVVSGGGRPIMLEFDCESVHSTTEQFIFVNIHAGTSSGFTPDASGETDAVATAMIDLAGTGFAPSNTRRNAIRCYRRITTSVLSAGTYYFKVSAFTGSANATMKAGNGLAGNYSPIFLRAVSQ